MKRKSRTNWALVDATKDEDIDYTDSPELDEEWFEKAVWGIPTKEIMTIRIDYDVLTWYKSSGPGYQTRINALLRAYMEAQLKKKGTVPAKKKRSQGTTKSRKRA